MLRSLKNLETYGVSATDGAIGSVANFLFDDKSWVVRYLVVETGSFFDRRRVLISPISFLEVDWAARRFLVSLSVDKVKNSPSVDVDKPVSRQHEQDYYRYYGYPFYWGYAGLWGEGIYPGSLATVEATKLDPTPSRWADVHLRSVNELVEYEVHGSDAAVGRVEDFIVDDESYAIRYLVVNISQSWLPKSVLVSPDWATSVSWEDSKISVDISRQAILDSPIWDAHAPIYREYETQLHDHYGRPVYWARSDGASVGSARLHRFESEAAGAVSGAIAGAILGVAAGPPGSAIGAFIGGVAGAIAGGALDTDAKERAARSRLLDSELGISEGDMGAPILKHAPAKTGAYSAASAGVDSTSGGASAEGPIPPPDA